MKTSILTICFFLTFFCHAQNTNYENLVLEGAGIRGIAYVGAIEALEKNGVLSNIKNVGGTSAGAIIALTISLGYTPEEIEKILFETNFNKFNSGSFFLFGGPSRLRKRYGWYNAKKFSRWLDKIIEDKTGNGDITLAEINAITGRDLFVVVTNLSQQKLVVFSKDNFPNMKVKDAVRTSMSIPLYFEAVLIDKQGKIHRKQAAGNPFDVYVDGGISGNYPIQIFDSTYIEDNVLVRVPNPKTLGIKIDETEQIQKDRTDQNLVPQDIHNFRDYIQAFYVYTLENLNRCNMTIEDWDRTILVASAGLGPKVKKLSKTTKNLLVQSGRDGVLEFFKHQQINE